MSIFGKMDALNIPTNPFFVKKGEYEAEVTDARFKEDREGRNQLHIQYTITDADSEYFNSKVQHFFTLMDPDMTEESMKLLPPDEQKKIRQTNASLKRTLCGSDGNEKQRGLGVDPDDLNKADWDPSTLVGTKVNLGVNNYGNNNEGVAVRWVNLLEE